MAGAPIRRVGLRLVLLGILAEVLAISAHLKSEDFAPGMFTWLVWLLIILSPVPVMIGAAILFRSRNRRV